MLRHQGLTERVVGVAIEARRTIGPGMLESDYARCLCLELEHAGVPFERDVGIPAVPKIITIPFAFRVDILVDGAIIPGPGAVIALLPVHEAQLLT